MSEAAVNEETSLVELRSVRKSFGDNVILDGIDLSIGRGEVVVIAGPSGSGKSTMLRCINGLEGVDEGEVRFDGRPVGGAGKALARLRAEIGMVFQQFNLFAHKTVMESVTLAPMEVKGLSKADARARGRKLLERVGISAKADAYPADLSGGQQQRVAIARALAMEPELMLFDEPTKFIEAISDNRIPFLQDGTADVILSTMTINEERVGQIEFSDPYFIAKGRILTKKDNTVISPLGSLIIAMIKNSAILGGSILALDDLLKTGRVIASRSFEVIPAFVWAAGYLILTGLATLAIRGLESRYAVRR